MKISVVGGHHLSGAGNWRPQEANGRPLPRAGRAKPSFPDLFSLLTFVHSDKSSLRYDSI